MVERTLGLRALAKEWKCPKVPLKGVTVICRDGKGLGFSELSRTWKTSILLGII